jgi:hypothetical protein
MMKELFYEKLSSELQVPADENKEEEEVVANTNDDDFLVQIMKQRRQNENGITNDDQTGVQQRVEQILEKELDGYFTYIAGIDYVDLIRQFPSDKYNEKTFNQDQVTLVKDPIYTARMFDVFAWWRVLGRNRFKFLEVCALIVLGKPIHNGFQERVFSRGTFTDDQLRRKMKESTFECAILEGINCDVVDKYMSIYTQKQKVSKEVVAERLETFWSSNKKLEENLKPNLSEDDVSSDEEEYVVEIDDELDEDSDDGYMSEE